MLKSNIKILITGGGSGGHLSVAKALVNSLIDDFNIPTQNITYVGSDLGMEGERYGNSLDQKTFKDTNIKKYFIRGGKLQRNVSLRSLILLLRSILGFFDSFKILFKVKPQLIISSGGYVSVPICTVAFLLRIPVYLHEQTATVGLANKIVGTFAKKIYISFKSSIKYFNSNKVIHTGNVVRKEIFLKTTNTYTDEEILKLVQTNDSLPLIYISGGSLGSHLINETVSKEIPNLIKKYRILLQTGDNEIFKDFDKGSELKKSLEKELQERLVIKKYIDENNIGFVLNNMDYFLGRSGANTVYEIGVLKKFALFIPIPWVTHNEQYLNAKVLEDIGTANILEEKYLDSTNLNTELTRLEEKRKISKIDNDKLEKLFPTNATSFILEDILREI